jgi:hypothetical protein
MTSLEIYGLLAPFILFGVCTGIAWWAHHQAVQDHVPSKRRQAHPAE